MRRERLEITKEILQAILVRLDHTHDDVNLRAAYCTAFAASYGWGSLLGKPGITNLISNTSPEVGGSVQLGVLLQLPASKTNPFRKWVAIPLSLSGDATCPVCVMRTVQSLPLITFGTSVLSVIWPIRSGMGTSQTFTAYYFRVLIQRFLAVTHSTAALLTQLSSGNSESRHQKDGEVEKRLY